MVRGIRIESSAPYTVLIGASHTMHIAYQILRVLVCSCLFHASIRFDDSEAARQEFSPTDILAGAGLRVRFVMIITGRNSICYRFSESECNKRKGINRTGEHQI